MSDTTAAITYRHTGSDVVCTLGIAGAAARMDEWLSLREMSGLEVEEIDGGLRLWLEPGSADAAADLARRESQCCGFLDFHLAADGARLRFDVTSPVPEAGAVIRALVVGGVEGQVRDLPGCCPSCGSPAC